MRKKHVDFQLNPNPMIRRRSQLKFYEGRRIQFLGFFKLISRNTNDYSGHKYNALFVEAHAIKDLTTQQMLNIDLEHIHSQIDNVDLNKYQGQFISFSAKVISYRSKYQGEGYETRFGLTDLLIENDYSLIINLNHINARYVNKLTLYEQTLIQKLIPLMNVQYENETIYSFDKIKKNILRKDNTEQRTEYLISALEKVVDKKPLGKKAKDFFNNNNKTKKINPQIKRELDKQINELSHQVDKWKVAYERVVIENQKLKLQQQKQLNNNNLASMNLFQVIYQYLIIRHKFNKNKRLKAKAEADKLKLEIKTEKLAKQKQKESEQKHEDASQESLEQLKSLFNDDRLK